MSIISSRIIGGGASSLAGFGFVIASMTSIASSIEFSSVNLFVVLTDVDNMYAAVSPSLSSLHYLLLLLPRLIYSDDSASCHRGEKCCGFD